MTIKVSIPVQIIGLMISVLLLQACNGKTEAPSAQGNANAAVPPAGRAGAGPVIAITTAAAVAKDFPLVLQAIGSITPVSSVDVRAQTSSVLTAVHVKEGQFVKAGELLFTLDSRADEAKVAQTQAQMAKDEASLADAKRQFARSKDLLAQNFISQGATDTSQAQVDAQLATVKADQAALDAARVSQSYSRVVAPGAGRVGIVNVYPGTTVQANLTSLATITQLDPIDVAFSVPQRHLSDVLAALKSGNANVKAKLPEGKATLNGRLSFVDNSVDVATGTVKVKARYANRDNLLWPGAFVNVELTASTLKNAVVIPTSAVIQTVKGMIVYVAANDKALLRPVTVLATQGEETAVVGIEAGDRVVLEGRQNLRPDAAVAERQKPELGKPDTKLIQSNANASEKGGNAPANK
jgi:RND family efflux transporter MFP subunit